MELVFKFSGRVAEGDLRHSTSEVAPDGALIAPNYVQTTWGSVPQYAATIVDSNTGYNPAGDCQGSFMSTNYQPNNNCYAYGCNIASNSFAQPGRASAAPTLADNFTAEHVRDNAISDGLLYVGATLADIEQHAATADAGGHYVALMFSPPEISIGGDPKANWPGDYHWARCDSLSPMSWSQKDGGDQVTNFDFAGNPIADPAAANWRVNQGPIQTNGTNKDHNEYVVTYAFYCYMYVPHGSVNII